MNIYDLTKKLGFDLESEQGVFALGLLSEHYIETHDAAYLLGKESERKYVIELLLRAK